MIGQMFLICVAQVTGNWPMWGSDPTHQSVQLTKGAMTTAPVIKWGFVMVQAVEWQFSAVADADGDGSLEVVIGSADGHVYCIDGATGTQEWSFATGGEVYSSPAVADADGDGQMEVVVGMDAAFGTVYCIDGATGTQEWSFGTYSYVRSSPAVADVDGDGGMEVVVGSLDGHVYCIDGATGSQKWSFATGNDVYSSPAVADADGDGDMEVVVGSINGNVYCLNGATGTQEWSFGTGATWLRSSPAVADVNGDGGMEVVIGSEDHHVYCIDGATGSQEWAFATGGGFLYSSPAVADVDGDGGMEVVIGTNDASGNVYCLNGADGGQEWSYGVGGGVISPGSLVDIDGDNRLEFLVHSWDTLKCLNAENGSLLWQIYVADYLYSSFAGDIDGDGCSEIIAGTGYPDANGYRVFALDDAGDASGCGPLYYDVEEGRGTGAMEFRPMGGGLYLYVPNQIQVSLVLYDASGRLVQNLYNGLLRPGAHTFIPNPETKGVYLAMLRYPGGTKTLKMVR